MKERTYPSPQRIKQLVKQLKKKENLKTSEAYELLSQEMNNSSWREFKPVLDLYWKTTAPSPQISLDFIEDPDVILTDQQLDQLETERAADFSYDMKARIAANKVHLAALGVDYSLFEPTITGFNKSILDATQQVRTHFELENFHYYYAQGQGPVNKVVKNAYLLTTTKTIESKASLYRPKTKNGDPRMWFKYLSTFAEPGDQIAIVIFENECYLINISQVELSNELMDGDNPISSLLKRYISNESRIADELLAKLRELAKYPMKALRKGDTAIGFTLETLLGIEANSSRLPDYKGIELKAGRGGKNRSNLFAQVANWDLSPCKKSAEILDKYGYQRGEDHKLYCTITTVKSNSQGLFFKYNNVKDQLEEWHDSSELVAIWKASTLRERLAEKHAETFWVKADSFLKDGIEYFQLKSVIHTKKPILTQLIPLIEAGVVTMDHLIKRQGANNRVSEKGPLFKIDQRNLNLLFPAPVSYLLT